MENARGQGYFWQEFAAIHSWHFFSWTFILKAYKSLKMQNAITNLILLILPVCAGYVNSWDYWWRLGKCKVPKTAGERWGKWERPTNTDGHKGLLLEDWKQLQWEEIWVLLCPRSRWCQQDHVWVVWMGSFGGLFRMSWNLSILCC